jgi:carbonic anhydrase
VKPYDRLLLENKAWANSKKQFDPEYFKRLSQNQSPEFLWIGCSDSRVPANEITGTEPGEMFVHRNIANLVVHTDLNLLSVLQYAVKVLKVQHIIVCGHYGCGGVKAAMTNKNFGLINKWLRNIKDVYRVHREELHAISDEETKANRLCELNVIEQVYHLAETSIVQQSWKEINAPMLHGWIYSLEDGIINELIAIEPNTPVDPIYRFDI